jgi:hypothetical protein
LYASVLDFQGLYTFPNPLSKVPVGGCLKADNLVANRDGIAESRRGFNSVGTAVGFTSGNGPLGIFPYQNRLIMLAGGFVVDNHTLFYDSTGTFNWTSFTQSYATPTGKQSYVSATEANKNLYFFGFGINNKPGTLKMSAYNTEPTLAGVAPGLDGSAALAGAGSGFLGAAFQCAYQVVFG